MRNPPEYYAKVGYEDHGYVSPELSSSNEYPDYIEAEVKESVRSIQEHQGFGTFSFGFMTDLHYATSYNHYIRMKRNINSYREITKRAHVDRLMLGGDYTNEGCKEYKSDCFRELRAHLSGVDYYPVNGNHDDGTIWDGNYICAETSTNFLSHEDMYNLFYNHLPSLGAEFDAENDGLYYVINDRVNKVRYVCLDSNDVPYIYDEKGKLKYGGQHLFAMSQAQLDWLCNTALSFDEEGWSVMFFAHSHLPEGREDGNLYKNLYCMREIITAFKNREKCELTYGEGDFERHVNADFSEGIGADVIGCFIGDHHVDRVDTYRGVVYVLTANSVNYYVGAPTQVPRSDGDKRELLYDIVTVDKKQRKLFITRVGAGEDRVVDY